MTIKQQANAIVVEACNSNPETLKQYIQDHAELSRDLTDELISRLWTLQGHF